MRAADRPIAKLLLDRWSPRAFDGSDLSSEAIERLIEAARWAPSAFNLQPWRFGVVRRDTPSWNEALGLLVPFNADWARRASALVFILSLRCMPGQDPGARIPSYSHSFDAGAAWTYLALQATSMGLSCHAMTGFDVAQAERFAGATRDMRIEAIVAVGRQGRRDDLPEPLRHREHPSGRKPIGELMIEIAAAPAKTGG